MSKKLLAGGIVRDLEFDSHESKDLYLCKLKHSGSLFQLIDEMNCMDGAVIIRILGQYNNSPLIQLFEEDGL